MLRATTDPMVNVFVVLTAVGAAVTLLFGGLSRNAKVGVAVSALVFIGLLKAFDAKFWGVVVMGGAVIIMFFLPWLDNSPVKSIRYRPVWHKWMYTVFAVNMVVLGYLGIKPPSDAGTLAAQIGTVFYFGFFMLMPWWSRVGEFKPVPDRVTFQPH
jgi:ubiquinol-cytochrome c reductase cytochrome b subunit